RAADELVRGEEDGVFAGGVGRASRRIARVHLDIDVGAGGGEVPEGERAVLMQQPGDRVGVAEDAGDVARRTERPDLERPIAVRLEFSPKLVLVDVAIGVLVDRHDISDRLPPWQLVAVVLERSDEDDGSFGIRQSRPDAEPLVEFSGHAQAQDLHERLYSTRRATTGAADE